jgi:polyribonucleotide nucleotidyltransferase
MKRGEHYDPPAAAYQPQLGESGQAEPPKRRRRGNGYDADRAHTPMRGPGRQ